MDTDYWKIISIWAFISIVTIIVTANTIRNPDPNELLPVSAGTQWTYAIVVIVILGVIAAGLIILDYFDARDPKYHVRAEDRTGVHPHPRAPRARWQRRKAIPLAIKLEVSERDGGRCVRCGSYRKLHYDHIIPWSKGGSDTVRNLQLLCERCNLKKGNRH